MKIYEMDGGLKKQLYNRVKRKNPKWKKYCWIYYFLWMLFLALIIVTAIVLYEGPGSIDLAYFKDLLVVTVGGGLLPVCFIFMVKGALYSPVGELMVAESQTITLGETELLSEWVVLPNQINNVQGTQVATVMPYNTIRRIVWNDTFERLEIHGDYRQQVKEFIAGWQDRDRTIFTLNKNEKILHIYGYFPQMQDLMNNLESLSGCRVEK